MAKRRLEDGFDLSGADKPAGEFTPIKGVRWCRNAWSPNDIPSRARTITTSIRTSCCKISWIVMRSSIKMMIPISAGHCQWADLYVESKLSCVNA